MSYVNSGPNPPAGPTGEGTGRLPELFRRSHRFVHGRDPTEAELAALVAEEEAARCRLGLAPEPQARPVMFAEPPPRTVSTWLAEAEVREAEAVRRLAHHHAVSSPLEAFLWYVARRGPAEHAPTIAACVEEFLVRKRCERVRASTLDAYYRNLGSFSRVFGARRPADLSPQEMSDYLARWPHPATRRHRWQILATFFRWLVAMRYAPDNAVLLGVRAPRVPRPERWVLSPRETRRLLKHALPGDTIGCWVLSLFAGLRTVEIAALQKLPNPWSVVLWGPGVIDLPATVTKTVGRLVPIMPVLRVWLRWLRADGRPFFPPNPWPKLRADRQAALARRGASPAAGRSRQTEFRSHNIGRRTYISCRLALPQAAYAAVADAVGNSEEMIREHYHRRVSAREARDYFALTPDQI